MRLMGILAVMAWPALAHADNKLDELKVGYQRESETCHRELAGVTRVTEGATTLAKTLEGNAREELDRDLAQLVKGRAAIAAYCEEVDGAVTLLASNEHATYRTLEHALDERDNKIRKLRAASKLVEAQLEPISHRLIPRINARVGQAAAEPRARVTFPSGRSVVLPALAGAWKLSGTSSTDVADYTDKAIIASVIVRGFQHATCEQQRRTIPSEAEHVVELPAHEGLVWQLGYTRRGHAVRVGCARQTDDAGWTTTVDVTPDDAKLVDELARLADRMLAKAVAK